MRRPYEILKRRDKARKALFKEECRKDFQVAPWNCAHNVELPLEGSPSRKTLRVCGLEPPITEGKVYACESCTQAEDCRAYAPKYRTQEDVARHFKDKYPTAQARSKAFPELAAYDWVLAEDLHALAEDPPWFLPRFLIWVISLQEKILESVWKKKNLENNP